MLFNMRAPLSSKGLVTVGVPQGCILGQLLFSIYVNDLPAAVTADDMELHYCHHNFGQLEHILQCALTQLFIWFISNKLRLSVPKSCVWLLYLANTPMVERCTYSI